MLNMAWQQNVLDFCCVVKILKPSSITLEGKRGFCSPGVCAPLLLLEEESVQPFISNLLGWTGMGQIDSLIV